MHKIKPSDQLFSLEQSRDLFPVRPDIRTLWRWILQGIGKPRQKLVTIKVGGRRYTTQAAIDDFIQRCSGDTETSPPSRKQRAKASRKRMAEAG